MKGMFKKFIALAATALLLSSQANAVLIEIVPSITSGNSGDVVTIDVVVSELNGDVVTAYDILMTFDDSYFAMPVAWTIGTGLGYYDFWSDALAMGVGTDAVDFSELSYLWNADFIDLGYQDGVGPLTLFSVDFTAIADFEAIDFAFAWDASFGYDVKCADPNDPSDLYICSPTEVPEPGTLALLGIGLLGMAASRRRRRI